MIRRKFFGLFGALPFIKIAPAFSHTQTPELSDIITATLRNRSTSIIDVLYSQNALLGHLKFKGIMSMYDPITDEPMSFGSINHEPSPMWRIGVE